MDTNELSSQIQSAATHRFRDLQNRMGESAKNLSKAANRYVHDKPWQTLAVAALAGCIIGFLLRPRGD